MFSALGSITSRGLHGRFTSIRLAKMMSILQIAGAARLAIGKPGHIKRRLISKKSSPTYSTSLQLRPYNLLADRKIFPPFSGVISPYDYDYNSSHRSPAPSAFLGEITSFFDMKIRLRLNLRDRDGHAVRLHFYDSSSGANFLKQEPKVGDTLCVMYPKQHYFMDATIGFRIEDEDMQGLRIVRTGLQDLLLASEFLCREIAGEGRRCGGCGKEGIQGETRKCEVCGIVHFCNEVSGIYGREDFNANCYSHGHVWLENGLAAMKGFVKRFKNLSGLPRRTG